MAATDYDVVVMGAGISGVAAAKNLLEAGLRIKVIESTDHVGGLWQFTEDGYGVTSFTHINVSKHNYCFSDYPFPEETNDFPSHKQMAAYINSYCDHFGVREHITFNTRVAKLSRNSNGTWRVMTINKSNEENVITSKGVIIATGHHATPVYPSFLNQDKFKGEVYHSVKFKDAEKNKLKDKRLLVVGIGNSGVDIVTHSVNYCPHVTISTRSGAWVFPNYIFGLPTDMYSNRLFLWLPWKLGTTILETLISILVGHPAKYGLNPKYHAFQTQPTVSPTLIHTIQRGYVDVKPNVREFYETGVIFEDGTRGDYDTVIYSTGYKIDLPFLDDNLKATILNETNNEILLYKNAFSPEIGHTLLFCGFVQPFSGGILSMAEIQARWYVELMKGAVTLPKREKIIQIIKQDLKKIASRFSHSQRHTIQQDPIIYTDEIASYIGAKPSFLSNPTLFFHLLLGSCGTYQYRLQGPGKWKEAKKWVKKAGPTPLMKISFIFFVFSLLPILVKLLLYLQEKLV
jgi:dimethylaniline monooxygenase (N-oxide forming)